MLIFQGFMCLDGDLCALFAHFGVQALRTWTKCLKFKGLRCAMFAHLELSA